MYLSKGNRKLTTGFLLWNLPASLTCIGSTPFCRKHCYAKKAERLYPQVLPNRLKNLEESKASFFTLDMITLIEKTVKGYKKFNGYFRIHEAGDFYSQDYLDAWKSIALHMPQIKFMAFTKSFHLSYFGVPDNLQIAMSIMPDTIEVPPTEFPLAYAGDCKDMVRAFECSGSCDYCKICWHLTAMRSNVHFKMH